MVDRGSVKNAIYESTIEHTIAEPVKSKYKFEISITSATIIDMPLYRCVLKMDQ
jgi:hypothetical protein